MALSFVSLVRASEITKNDAMTIFNDAAKYKNKITNNQNIDKILQNKIIATLFFEPSTRTRLSFEAAASLLGASVISVHSKDSSSIAKHESIADTAKIVSAYCSVMIVRHWQIGSVAKFAKNASVPVINAGDGANEHPTQALLDAFTIYEKFNRLENLEIAFCGDILHSRTIFSLISLLSVFGVNKFTFIASSNFQISLSRLEELQKINPQNTFNVIDIEGCSEFIKRCDVLYVTRVQKERIRFSFIKLLKSLFANKKISTLIVNHSILQLLKNDAIIMHPLPRVDEISTDVDNSPHSHYFNQAKNGLYIRMALLKNIVEFNI